MRFRAIAGDGASIHGIAFRAASEPLGRALQAGRGNPVHLAGILMADRFGGRDRVQLRLIDLAQAAAVSKPICIA
jgi:single-stranded-DNA-specific exonuclease